MATVGSTGGQANGAKGADKFDLNLTKSVIEATGPKASPRLRKVFGSLVQHLHDFCRENEVTIDEFFAGIDLINAAGKISDERRNEGQLVADILGLETLCDEITYKLVSDAADHPTATAILGPFWRKDAPKYPMDASIVQNDIPDGDHAYMFGRVTDFVTGEPIEGAELDIWHTAPNGLYEQQDENQPDFNLRGRFTTGKDGKYSFYCLRPTSYPIPFDGPAGKLLTALDRHPYRPAHIHFIITAPNYKPIVTQVFDRRDKYLTNDSVFAVKDSLVVEFKPRDRDPKANFELDYDFKLASYEEAKNHSLDGTTEFSSGT